MSLRNARKKGNNNALKTYTCLKHLTFVLFFGEKFIQHNVVSCLVYKYMHCTMNIFFKKIKN